MMPQQQYIADRREDLLDFAIDHMALAPLANEFLKKFTDCQIERNKHYSVQRLLELQIPIQH